MGYLSRTQTTNFVRVIKVIRHTTIYVFINFIGMGNEENSRKPTKTFNWKVKPFLDHEVVII